MYNTEYRIAARESVLKDIGPKTNWGHTTTQRWAEMCDAADAYDGAGATMPEGGLTAREEWALEFAEWCK